MVLKRKTAGLVVGLAVVSHVLRDADGAIRLLSPLAWPRVIPRGWSYVGEMALVFAGSHALWSMERARVGSEL